MHRCGWLVAFTSLVWNASKGWAWSLPSSRREWLARSLTGALIASDALTCSANGAVAAADATDELPSFVRPFTKLAPLGSPKKSSSKSLDLPLAELATRLSRDLVDGATGEGGYFVTGDLSQDIFRDDCVFVDPTNQVSSLSQYQNALRILFDPSQSEVQLVRPLEVDEEARTITATIRSRGVLQLPWHPRVKAYESKIVYKVGDEGLIYEQSQTWSKSATEALRESFTPNLFGSPPTSPFAPSFNETSDVTKKTD